MPSIGSWCGIINFSVRHVIKTELLKSDVSGHFKKAYSSHSFQPTGGWWTSRRTVVSDWRDWTRLSDWTGLLFFVSAVLLSTFIPLFLPSSSVSLSYFNLAVPMRGCFWKHSCMSSSFSIAILNGNLLSSGTNTLLWWRACYQITKLQTNYRPTCIGLGSLWRGSRNTYKLIKKITNFLRCLFCPIITLEIKNSIKFTIHFFFKKR